MVSTGWGPTATVHEACHLWIAHELSGFEKGNCVIPANRDNQKVNYFCQESSWEKLKLHLHKSCTQSGCLRRFALRFCFVSRLEFFVWKKAIAKHEKTLPCLPLEGEKSKGSREKLLWKRCWLFWGRECAGGGWKKIVNALLIKPSSVLPLTSWLHRWDLLSLL